MPFIFGRVGTNGSTCCWSIVELHHSTLLQRCWSTCAIGSPLVRLPWWHGDMKHVPVEAPTPGKPWRGSRCMESQGQQKIACVTSHYEIRTHIFMEAIFFPLQIITESDGWITKAYELIPFLACTIGGILNPTRNTNSFQDWSTTRLQYQVYVLLEFIHIHSTRYVCCL